MSKPLRFTIPGKPVSGNHRTAPGENGGVYVTREARTYANRIKSIAQAAVITQGWRIPDYASVTLIIHNISMDTDNVAKSVHAPLQGFVIVDDRRILVSSITRVKDDSGQRVEVIVAPLEGATFGFSNPRKIPNTVVRGLPAHVQASIERGQ